MLTFNNSGGAGLYLPAEVEESETVYMGVYKVVTQVEQEAESEEYQDVSYVVAKTPLDAMQHAVDLLNSIGEGITLAHVVACDRLTPIEEPLFLSKGFLRHVLTNYEDAREREDEPDA